MKATEKNRFDSIYLLWKGAWNQFNIRRTYEWKFCLAVWTALSSFIALVLTGRLHLFENSGFIITGTSICAILILVLFIIWINGLSKACDKDREIAYHYERILKQLSRSNFNKKLLKELEMTLTIMFIPLKKWNQFVQISITIVLTIACVLAVFYSSRGIC